MFKLFSVVAMCAALAFTTTNVDAKKLGGGKSVGAQRSSVSDAKSGAPSAAPASAAMAAPAAGAAGAAAAAAKPSMMSRMAGPLMGIAAGLGLGYLFSQLGGGAAGMIGMLLLGLVVVGALVFFGRKLLSKQQPALAGANAGSAANAATPFGAPAAAQPLQYAGADTRATAAASAVGGAALAGAALPSGLAGGFGIPAGFDKAGFEEQAKKQFMSLQAANDKGDLDAVRDFATDEFYNQIAKDVVGGNKEATHVEELHANLMGIETERGQYWASVEFSGKMREDGMVMGSAFSEVWNLVKPVDGSKGWLVAGIQQA